MVANQILRSCDLNAGYGDGKIGSDMAGVDLLKPYSLTSNKSHMKSYI